MYSKLLLATLAVNGAQAFPWVARMPGVDSSLIERDIVARVPGDQASCPFNSNHTGAAPYTAAYPYCGASNGVPGKQSCPNNLVPAKGDTAHYFEAPGPNDIRGPCPGLNTAGMCIRYWFRGSVTDCNSKPPLLEPRWNHYFQ